LLEAALPEEVKQAASEKLAEIASSATSPVGLASLALPGIVGPKIAAAAFAPIAAKQLYSGAKEVAEGAQEGDLSKITKGAIEYTMGTAGAVGVTELAKTAPLTAKALADTGVKIETPPIIEAAKGTQEAVAQVEKSTTSETVAPTESVPLAEAAATGVQPLPPIIGMGGAVPSEFPGRPTIDQILTPEVRASLPDQAAKEAEGPTLLSKVADAYSSAKEAYPGWMGGLAGETLPKTTRQNQALGELGARWVASKDAARPMGTLFAHDVLNGLNVDQAKFDAALKADNLLSIKGAFERNARQLEEQGKSAEAESELAHADAVNTLLDSKGFPFKTEEELQSYFKEPEVQEAVKRHIDNWNNVIEPMYRRSLNIDPSEELPSRGLYSGARINLNPILEGEPKPSGQIVGKGGNLLGTMRRKDPFARKAYGTGQEYALNYPETIANTLEKRMEIANKKEFEDHAVESGNAKIAEPGKTITLEDGSPTVPYPLLRRGFENKNIYIRKSLAKEYETAANVNLNPYRDTVLKHVADTFNKLALAGLTDATVHVGNLSTALFQVPGAVPIVDALLSAAFRADVPLMMVKAGIKALPNIADTAAWKGTLQKYVPQAITDSINKAWMKNQTQYTALAQIGAARAPHGGNIMSRAIMASDRLTRGLLDDTYKGLVEAGLVKNSETARREFVNQVGQYNLRAQGPFTRFLRTTGLAPFVTAGKSFNVLGLRGITLNPGVEAVTAKAAALLRANMIAKWLGTYVLIRTANYLISGKPEGRKGVPMGAVDEGGTDANGKPLYVSVITPLGQSRALRASGVRGVIEAKRMGLDNSSAADSAVRDIANTALGPVVGPLARAVAIGFTGQAPGVGIPRTAPVVPPGKSQALENIKSAVLEANPVVASIHDIVKPGGGIQEALRRQLPRFTLSGGKPDSLAENYPKIVERAKASAFVDDVIHRARYMSPQDRAKYLSDALQMLPADYREHAKAAMKLRKVL
jgi:hypothetical protein